MPVVKPTVGQRGWNVAVDEVIDIVNTVEDVPARLTAVEAAVAGSTVQWFSGDGAPPDFIPGARPGDMYIDESGGGLYQL